MRVEDKKRIVGTIIMVRTSIKQLNPLEYVLLHGMNKQSEDVVKQGNTQYLLQSIEDYRTAIEQANKMLALAFEVNLPKEDE